MRLVPRVKAYALPLSVETSNAESPTPMYDNLPTLTQGIDMPSDNAGALKTPFRGVPVALLLTDSLNLRSSNTSKPKRKKVRLSM